MYRLIPIIAILFAGRTAVADAPVVADASSLTVVAIENLSRVSLVDHTWAQPTPVPATSATTPVLANHLVELGNDFLARHLGVLTGDLVGVELDATNRLLNLHVGGGSTRYGNLRVAANIAVTDGSARIAARVRLGVADQSLMIRLPAVEVTRVSYREERGVELRLPFVHAKF